MIEEKLNNFVYKITNKDTLKSYIGIRSSDLKPLEDVGVNYFTSSSDLEFYNDFVNNTYDYSIEILGNYDSREKAINKEVELHEKFNVDKSPLYYNKAKQTSKKFDCDWTGKKHSEESKRKLSISHTGKVLSQETREKMSISNIGKVLSDITRGKIKEANIGKTYTQEVRDKMSKSMIIGSANMEVSKCVHCDAVMKLNFLNRYHNDNCKYNKKEK